MEFLSIHRRLSKYIFHIQWSKHNSFDHRRRFVPFEMFDLPSISHLHKPEPSFNYKASTNEHKFSGKRKELCDKQKNITFVSLHVMIVIKFTNVSRGRKFTNVLTFNTRIKKTQSFLEPV